MKPSEYLELAERCEKASGPDRALDAAIGAAVGAEPFAICDGAYQTAGEGGVNFLDRANLVDYSGEKPKYHGFVRLADATWWDIHGRKLSDDPEWNKWLLECNERDNRRLRNGGCF